MDKVDALIIGGGPAGLMAASVLAERGARVMVADQMPTLGRKFLMAGKSGLNLTKAEAREAFVAQYSETSPAFARALDAFGPDEAAAWAETLGESMFTGSTGRVFPVAMKASGLLRRWRATLLDRGVVLRTRWRWTGWYGDAALFETPQGTHAVDADATVLALGGGSWRRLGSDGAWLPTLEAQGAEVEPFEPSNVGFHVEWSPHMAGFAGQPVKGVHLSCGRLDSRGEWVLTQRGIEGGGVYQVSRALREGVPLLLDLLPDVGAEEAVRKLGQQRKGDSLSNRLRKGLGLTGVRRALLMELGRPLPETPEALVAAAKRLVVPVVGPFPLDEAISTAGGLCWSALDGFMLTARPGTFAAGEMIGWDAPTGGYLLTASLATGRAAGLAAADWIA